MDASDLEQYEYQLSQVKLALAKDPSNAELLSLRDEVTSLITLTKEILAASGPPASASASPAPAAAAAPKPSSSKAAPRPSSATPTPGGSTPTPSAATLSLKSGDKCQARYSGDGKFYPARITSIGGSDSNRVFSVIFEGYDSTEIVSSGDIKALSEGKKRALEVSEEDLEKERRRKKNEKKNETKAVKTQEQGERQKSWQSFAKKGAKKGLSGVGGPSMFRSPDDGNPNAKVGVVGSGKGMTTIADRKRQTFNQYSE
ncbi:hypothetical protein MNV49_001635 [Pseudohyphozyma bogoriensis]|nr:hypothetical protein MNV49_001635 [Pseudohyphozyma bogoriensis]